MNGHDSRPNILIVMPDQMRGDCLSLENHPALETPNIDRIGREGAHFTRAYTTCASCIPARRCMLTGQFPSTNGVVGYHGGVPLKAPTFVQLLHDAGYATVLAGRCMHQHPPTEPYGFETRVLGSTYVRDDDYARFLDEKAPELGGIRGIGLSCNGREAKPWPIDEALHPTNWTVRQACGQLAAQLSDRPLLLVASFYAPHPPLFPLSRFMDKYLQRELPPAAIGQWDSPPERSVFEGNVDSNRVDLRGEELHRAQAGYFGLISQLDELLPDLLEDFKAKSESEGRPWVIVFTSDHGEMLGDHHLFRKCEPYEGSSRIPFLIAGSEALGFVPGTRCASPVCLEDIMPTLLDLADVEIPGDLDGRSLIPVLRGEAKGVRTILHGEHSACYDEGQAYHFLTDGRMKYIWRPVSDTEQLFDLAVDPQELHDLSSGRTGDLSPWRSRLATFMDEGSRLPQVD